MAKVKRIGIYKITSPTGRTYIGQTIDINRRFSVYRRGVAHGQPKLSHSFVKHGVSNHLFEVICECQREQLDELERHYIKFYSSVETGLNAAYGGVSNQVFTDEARRKISEKRKGKKHSPETLAKMSQKSKGRKFGPMTDEEKEKRRRAYYNNPHNAEKREKMSVASLGNIHNAKQVICLSAGTVYNSVTEAANTLNVPRRQLYFKLSNGQQNDTTLRYAS
jgi:group I intron endonuclease